MTINPCADCGGDMRLSAMRITVNRHRGVAHAIVHMGSTACRSAADFNCAMMKPYPKKQEQPATQMMNRWNAAHPKATTEAPA